MIKGFLVILSLGCALYKGPFVTGQEISSLLKNSESVILPTIEFGMDKINNTFVFTGNLAADLPVLGGRLVLMNEYRGSAFRTLTTAVRDDETASLSYSVPLTTGTQVLVRGSWITSRDNRSVGLSSLDRLNGVVGIQLAPSSTLTTETFAGVEQTTQLGVVASGPIAGLVSRLRPTTVEQVELDGSVLLDWHKIDPQRTNSDALARLSAQRVLDDGSLLRAQLGAQTVRREYFTTLTGGATTPDAVEQRLEDKLEALVELLYHVQPTFAVGATGQVSLNGIGRAYGEPLSSIPITAVSRHLQEFVLDFEVRGMWNMPKWTVQAGVAQFLRSENNTVDAKFALNAADFAVLQQQEYQRDNRTNRSRFFARAWWTPSASDTVFAEYNWYLLQYDTPSDANTDDRDELNLSASLRYTRRISERLQVGVTLGAQRVHLVYLKAARSAFNNENNVIRLSPHIVITSGFLSMRPTMEVLANYTVYDFEGKGASARSFGFRQLSYRDSVRLRLSERYRVEIPTLIRYFERSTLLWNEFAEIPQAGTLEYLVSVRAFTQPAAGCDVGAGVRLYTFDQQSLIATPGLPTTINSVRSWAPEVVCSYTTTGGSTLEMSGWYEFQSLVPAARRELPNVLLKATIML